MFWKTLFFVQLVIVCFSKYLKHHLYYNDLVCLHLYRVFLCTICFTHFHNTDIQLQYEGEIPPRSLKEGYNMGIYMLYRVGRGAHAKWGVRNKLKSRNICMTNGQEERSRRQRAEQQIKRKPHRENAENCNPINGLRLQCLAYP